MTPICDPASDRVEIVNAAAIDQLMAGSGPALPFGGHFANWQVNAMLECWVRARQKQWLWLHRRWPD